MFRRRHLHPTPTLRVRGVHRACTVQRTPGTAQSAHGVSRRQSLRTQEPRGRSRQHSRFACVDTHPWCVQGRCDRRRNGELAGLPPGLLWPFVGYLPWCSCGVPSCAVRCQCVRKGALPKPSTTRRRLCNGSFRAHRPRCGRSGCARPGRAGRLGSRPYERQHLSTEW